MAVVPAFAVPAFDSPPQRSARRRQQLLAALRERLGRAAAPAAAEDAVTFSSGAAAIDRLLPGSGLQHGMLVEWLAQRPACGAATLALLAAREACRTGGLLVVLDRAGMFYPLAAAGWGVDPARLLVVRPPTARDEIWAAVQALRSPVVAALWTMIDRLESRNFRRLQLAAEAGRTLGVLVRGAAARGQPSWADVRLDVKAEGGRGRGEGRKRSALSFLPPSAFSFPPLFVSVLHVRGGRSGGSVCVEIDEAAHEVREVKQPKAFSHDPHPLPVVAELADSAARSQSARA
jgi:protein ImuA